MNALKVIHVCSKPMRDNSFTYFKRRSPNKRPLINSELNKSKDCLFE